jgi:hypothetical protein
MEWPIGKPRTPSRTIATMQLGKGGGIVELGWIALRRLRAPDRLVGQPAVTTDARDTEDNKDAVKPIDRYMEIGRALHLHEADIVVGGRQRDSVEGNNRDASQNRENAACARGNQRIDNVEADLFGLAKNECRSPQHSPKPSRDDDLFRPPHRTIEYVTCENLDDEGCKHYGQKCNRNVLGSSPEPASGLLESRVHQSIARQRAGP